MNVNMTGPTFDICHIILRDEAARSYVSKIFTIVESESRTAKRDSKPSLHSFFVPDLNEEEKLVLIVY